MGPTVVVAAEGLVVAERAAGDVESATVHDTRRQSPDQRRQRCRSPLAALGHVVNEQTIGDAGGSTGSFAIPPPPAKPATKPPVLPSGALGLVVDELTGGDGQRTEIRDATAARHRL